MASYTCSVFIGNLKILLFSYIHTPISLFFIFGSMAFYVMTHGVASMAGPGMYVYRTFNSHWVNINYYFVMIVTIVFTVGIDMAITSYLKFNKKSAIVNIHGFNAVNHRLSIKLPGSLLE